MSPERRAHIANIVAPNLRASARQVTGPTGESLDNAADVIRELLDAIDAAQPLPETPAAVSNDGASAEPE